MVTNKLVDEESKVIYEARCAYMKEKDYIKFWNRIKNIQKEWKIYDKCFDFIYKGYTDKREIIIYGCGLYGIHTKIALETCGVRVSFFCDSDANLKGTIQYGLEVISPELLCQHHKDAVVIIATKKYGNEIYNTITSLGFPANNIVIPEEGIIRAFCGNQYFDYFTPESDEVFVDAGAYDGETTLEFARWTNNKYAAVYALEPFEAVKSLLEEKVRGMENVTIVYKAAWNQDEVLHFGGDPKAFEINGGDATVVGVKIDDIVGGGGQAEKVTFIKMDIEGSEYQALLGAEKTIKSYKPKLAICLYHKEDDIIRLPNLIEKMVPDYKYAIRHYSSGLIETVLYAWI